MSETSYPITLRVEEIFEDDTIKHDEYTIYFFQGKSRKGEVKKYATYDEISKGRCYDGTWVPGKKGRSPRFNVESDVTDQLELSFDQTPSQTTGEVLTDTQFCLQQAVNLFARVEKCSTKQVIETAREFEKYLHEKGGNPGPEPKKSLPEKPKEEPPVEDEPPF